MIYKYVNLYVLLTPNHRMIKHTFQMILLFSVEDTKNYNLLESIFKVKYIFENM